MLTYLAVISALPTRQRGLTTVEYALGGALIAVVIIGAVTLLGTNVSNVFGAISNALS